MAQNQRENPEKINWMRLVIDVVKVVVGFLAGIFAS